MARKKQPERPCVLFSPIGTTDPTRDFRDGPFLHILRRYKPVTAVLFLTKEMLQHHNDPGDDRYRKAARHVSPGTGLRVSAHEEIVDAHHFNVFDSLFREELNRLHAEYPDCRLLVNISSGTPQMEAALYLLAATLPYAVTAVQVETPAKGANRRSDPKAPYIVEDEMVCLEDDEPGRPDRCIEVKPENATAAILRKNIGVLAHSGSYAAALQLADSAEELFDPRLFCLLRAGLARLSLDTAKARRQLQLASEPAGQYFETDDPIYEGVLVLKSLLARKAYADYARALSPVLVELARAWLKTAYGVTAEELCTGENGRLTLSPGRIAQKDPGLKEYLDEKYNGRLREGPLGLDALVWVLQYYEAPSGGGRGKDASAWEGLITLRQFESRVRNLAAHVLRPVTADDFRALGRLTPEEVNTLLTAQYEELCGRRQPGKKFRWDGYQRLNARIEQLLQPVGQAAV